MEEKKGGVSFSTKTELLSFLLVEASLARLPWRGGCGVSEDERVPSGDQEEAGWAHTQAKEHGEAQRCGNMMFEGGQSSVT